MIFYRKQKTHEEGRQPADAAGNFLRSQKKLPAIFSLSSVLSVSSNEPGEWVRAIRSFTLIEILVVMVVIAILVGITIPISKYVTLRARLANQRIYIEKIKSALEDYRAAYGEYPITPSAVDPITLAPSNYADVLRHYDLADYATECATTTNSPFMHVNLTTGTVETMEVTTTGGGITRKVDYCLTYPLMLKQRKKGARPFMEFKDITVLFYVYSAKMDAAEDKYTLTRRHKTAGGNIEDKDYQGIYGNPVKRPEAIDPVSQKQWKYISEDGLTYTLATNSF